MSACECGSCGRVFGTMELFDAHQHWDRAGEWTLTCVLPPGLVQDARGTWQTPEGFAKRAADAARFAAARSGGVAGSRFQGRTHTPGTPQPSEAAETEAP